ncbi:unnamed protein product, partial [Oppiella nova]
MKWSANQLLRKTGDYIYGVHIDQDHFFNYGDSYPREIYDPSVVLEYGKFEGIAPKAPQPIESWFPDLQLITLRTNEGSPKGLFLGAKAGANYDTQHNHNDVGSFVVYVDGLPALIDIGVGTYTINTFSKDRYSIWTFQSQWHNSPTINGIQQECGPQYKAQYAKYTKLENGGQFEADIAGAYPTEAQVKSW